MFAVLHIILIIGCLMARFLVIDHLDFSADPEEFAPVIALLIVVLTMLFSAISFGCCIMYAVRFYKNLFTDEGYITWTLPASPLTQSGRRFCLPPSGMCWILQSALPLRGF